MNHLYFGVVGMKITPPAAFAGGLRPARYWRIDNIIRHSSGTQIYGFKFFKGGANDTNIEPASITTDNGDETSLYNVSRHVGDSGIARTIDAITFFNFDFGVKVQPDRLEIWGVEWDVDYVLSFDISWSDDNATWTKIAAFDSETNPLLNRIWPDGANHWAFMQSDLGTQISSPKISTVTGRANNGITLNRPVLFIPQGRRPDAMVLNGPVINVIDKPV